MRLASEADVVRHFEIAKREGYIPVVMNAGYDVPPEILLALASRESNMGTALDKHGRGDSGHGYSPWQIDVRSFPEWCHNWKNGDIASAAHMAAFVWRSYYNATESRDVPLLDRARVTCACYNTGPRAIDAYLRGHVDAPTTGHDYSSDVMWRSSIMRVQLKKIITLH